MAAKTDAESRSLASYDTRAETACPFCGERMIIWTNLRKTLEGHVTMCHLRGDTFSVEAHSTETP